MPEYLAPGVFVEEVSFRSKSIEGVSTSTTGLAGHTRWGPVCYRDGNIQGPTSCEPRLITSFTEFERVYGGLEELQMADTRIPYLAHAARAFFENGGRRLYVSRVFIPRVGNGAAAWGIATRSVAVSDINAIWTARWPGVLGNVFVKTEIVRSKNLTYDKDGVTQVRRARAGAVVEVITGAASDSNIAVPDGNDELAPANLRVVQVDSEGVQTFINEDNDPMAITMDDVVQLVEMKVSVIIGNGDSSRLEEFNELAASPLQKRYIGRILQKDDPEDQDAPIWFDWRPDTSADPDPDFLPALLMASLQTNPNGRLEGGHDGDLAAIGADYTGHETDVDDPLNKATGLEALAEIDDISIVAIPDAGDLGSAEQSRVVAQALITHAEKMKYRIALVDGPIGSSLNEIRDFRGQLDSKHAALYYPWIKIYDPNERFSQGTPPRQLSLPPSGFVAGIYARNDITRGVHKAPANEIVRGLTQFEVNINKPRNEVINPEGINALRFFEGRGYRVWGARTMSSDPEWKYVNVRRLFNFIEHSIDKGTQWAVFEPNNQRLWDNIRRTIEDFLLVLWRDGALLGAKPEQAYFVRCDRTTMTQNDLDNGRLICLIGIAPVKPAEFVIFRIGQWTGDA